MSTSASADRPLLAVAVLATFVAFLDGSVVNLALPAISREFGADLTLQQWVVDGYLLTLGSLILVAGAISDRFGRLSVLRVGVALFGIASILCALAPSGPVLVAARCLQGVGAAFLVPSSLAMINTRFSNVAHARAVGTWTAWTGTAFVVGPLFGGVLVDVLGWRWIFAVNVVPLAVTAYLTTKVTGADNDDRRATGAARAWAGVDVPGALLNAVGLSTIVFALIEQQRFGLSHPVVLTGLAVGVACLLAFGWWERRAPHPMVPVHIFGARNFTVGNLTTLFLYAAVSLGMLVVVLFLQQTAGLSAAQAGLATLPIPVLSFLLARRFGGLAGRHGPRWYMTSGPLLAAAGFLLMSGVRDPFDFWTQLLPGLVAFSLGLSITVSPLTAAVLAAVTPAESGIGSAINNAVSRMAGLIAIAFTGLIVGVGEQGDGAGSGVIDFDGFGRVSLVVAGLLALAGMISAIGIRNAQHDERRVSPRIRMQQQFA